MTTVSIEAPAVGASPAQPRPSGPAFRPPWRCFPPPWSCSWSMSAACSGRCASFTSSTLLPRLDWIGFTQYSRLIVNDRFVISAENIAIFGILFISGCLILGFLLAVFIDQNVRSEGLSGPSFYPYAMSFVVTGVVWQWFLNPGLGLQKLVRDLGFETFTFDWIVSQDMAIYTIVIAGIWHGSGLTMAILLAGCAASTRTCGRPPASMESRPGATTSRSCCRFSGP